MSVEAYDITAPSQRYLNLFGGGVDETAERVKTYNEAKNRWPANTKISTCDSLETIIQAIQLSIDAEIQSKANDDSAANARIRNRYIDGYTQWMNEVKVMYTDKKCEQQKADQESKQFFDTQYENLQRVQGLSKSAGNTTKYLIFGMLGLVVLVSGIIIFKKN